MVISTTLYSCDSTIVFLLSERSEREISKLSNSVSGSGSLSLSIMSVWADLFKLLYNYVSIYQKSSKKYVRAQHVTGI